MNVQNLGSSGVKPEILHFPKTLGIVDAAGCNPHEGSQVLVISKQCGSFEILTCLMNSGKHVSQCEVQRVSGETSGVHIRYVSQHNSPKFSSLRQKQNKTFITSYKSVGCLVSLYGTRGLRLSSVGMIGKPVPLSLFQPQKVGPDSWLGKAAFPEGSPMTLLELILMMYYWPSRADPASVLEGGEVSGRSHPPGAGIYESH